MGRVNYIGVDTVTNTRIIPNAFTCWMDGSGLYGNSEDALNTIRTYKGGLLKSFKYPTGSYPGRVVGGPLDGFFEYSIPNVNIAPVGIRLYVQLSEFPDFFYVPTLTGGPLEPYSGYKPNVNPQIDLFFSQVAFIYGHSGLNENVLRLDDAGDPIEAGHLLLREGSFKNLCDEVIAHGIEPFLRGFVTQLDNKIDTKMVDDLRNSLPLNPGFHFDLTAIGIQR
ncbi:UNVERIFIED_CONTAM: Peroxidase mlt-7 [Siphonaria sp. JEL0065]|nr:Peroxidase mlt-7 [Siphonaria sp. JEL0065]